VISAMLVKIKLLAILVTLATPATPVKSVIRLRIVQAAISAILVKAM
jgi:hypothetical protein